MSKTKRICYWIATIWLSLGMASTGMVQLLRMKEETAFVVNMGYPEYFLVLLGIWKIMGVIAVLIPKFTLLKEWAYAGFFFAMTGAIFSHFALGHSIGEILPPLLLLALTVASWYLRPPERRISSVNQLKYAI